MGESVAKKIFYVLCVVFFAFANPAHADDKIVLQLNWLHQAQFAGYYVALENGYYADEDLEVDIRPGGPATAAGALMLAAGVVDVAVEWMPAALVARENKIPLVNIAQPFKHSGAEITCLRSFGIKTLDDLRGKRIGHRPGPQRLQTEVLLDKLGIPFDNTASGGPQADNSTKLLAYNNLQYGLAKEKVDCISTLSYSDSVLLADAGFHENELIVFAYDNLGVATL